MKKEDINKKIKKHEVDLEVVHEQLDTKVNKNEVANGLTAKGKSLYSTLPTEGNKVGDYYYCSDGNGVDGAGNYVWNGTSWYFGGTGDEGYSKLKENIDNLGLEIIESSEYIKAITDSDNKTLFGIKKDGSIEWQKGIPKPIKDIINEETFENLEYLKVITDSDGKVLLGVKKDGSVEWQKGVPKPIKELINETTVDNPEYLKVITDSDNKVLFGIKKDGSIQWEKGIPKPIKDIINEETLDNSEYMKVITDNEGKILIGIKKDGSIVSNVAFKCKKYNYSDDNIEDLKIALEKKGFDFNNILDWSKASELKISKPDFAIINVSNIISMPTSKTENSKAYFEFWDMNGNYFKKKAILNAQGNSSLDRPKKNISIDICNDDWLGDDTFNLKIGEWVSQDSFHIKAYYDDFVRGVATIGYKIYDQFNNTKDIFSDKVWKKALINSNDISATSRVDLGDLELQFDNGARCYPDGFPCAIYLNGEFYGIFSFQLKKHYKNMHMVKKLDKNIHLDGILSIETLFNTENIQWTQFEVRNPKTLYTVDGRKYDGDTNCNELIDDTYDNYDLNNSGHVLSNNVKRYIKSLSQNSKKLYDLYLSYLNSSKSEEKANAYRTEFEKYFDVDNLIDYIIFGDITNNYDGYSKNWQWATYDGVKWYVCPYDLDGILGNEWTGRGVMPNLTKHLGSDIKLPTGGVIEFYKDSLEKRYKELRDCGVIDTKNIISIINEWTDKVGIDNYQKEYLKWSESTCKSDSIYRFYKWIDKEIQNMDIVYNYTK